MRKVFDLKVVRSLADRHHGRASLKLFRNSYTAVFIRCLIFHFKNVGNRQFNPLGGFVITIKRARYRQHHGYRHFGGSPLVAIIFASTNILRTSKTVYSRYV